MAGLPAIMIRFALTLVLSLTAISLAAEERVALVFGAEKYRSLRVLENPLNDALAIADTLESLGFEVSLETNRDLRRMRRALEDFAEDAAGADVALVYFAGHGLEVSGRNLLMPVDADPSSLDALRNSALPLDEVAATLTAIAPVGLVVIDACRSDPFAGTSGSGRGAFTMDSAVGVAGFSPGLGRVGRADNLLFAFAAAPGQAAADGTDGNAPFTEALLRHLPVPGLELRGVLTLVQQDVYERTRGAQLPYVESGLPALVFAAGRSDLPEREQLLLAMAELSPDDRTAVERVAARFDMPLAPLFGALLQAGLARATVAERDQRLEEAATRFARVRDALLQLGSDDARVTGLRREAERQLALGAFDTARATLDRAAALDRNSRDTLRENYRARTLSEAETLYLRGGAAAADLRRDLAVSDYQAAIALFDEARVLDPGAVGRVSHLAASAELPALLLVLGDTGAALAAMANDEALIRSLPEFDATGPYWQRQLIQRKFDFATILKNQGRVAEARTVFGAGLDLAVAQLAESPDWPELQGDYALLLTGLGDVAATAMDWVEADALYRESLEIRQRLRQNEPDNRVLMLTEARLWTSLGRLAHARGDLDGAGAAFGQSEVLRDRLVALNPEDTEFRLGLARTHVALGAVAADQTAFAQAEHHLSKGYDALSDLALRDPANTDVQSALTEALGYLALVRVYLGDPGSARDYVARAAAISSHLAALDPNNLELALEVSASHDMVGVLALQEHDRAGARAAFATSRDIRSRLVLLEPGRTDWKWTLLISHYMMALASDDPTVPVQAVQKMLDDPVIAAQFQDLADRSDPMVLWLRSEISRLPDGN